MELVTELATFDEDPLGFVLFAYPWGVEGSPLAQVDGPYRWQVDELRALGDHTREQVENTRIGRPLKRFQSAKSSGRGIGKSALFGWVANWQTSCRIGSSVIVTANTEGQLKGKTFPEFGRWYTMAINAHWWEVDSMKVTPQEWIAALVRDQLKIDTGYWGVFGENWSQENPDAFAGVHNMYGLSVLFDEASGIPEPIWNVSRGFFTEKNPYRHWIVMSQMRRNEGAFYNRFYHERYARGWRTEILDATTVEGGDQEVYADIAREEGKDSDVYRVEVLGLPPESSENQFIPTSYVVGAERREIPDHHRDWTHNLIMGVDPAPRGRTVIAFRCGRDARSIPWVTLKGKNNIEIAREISRLAIQYGVDAVAIDEGMGTGVIDYLKEIKFHRRFPLYTVLFGQKAEHKEWATRGTELWGDLRDWLKDVGCIPINDRFRRDAIARQWKWHGREENKKILESKKDLEKRGLASPDDVDALAVTFAPKLKPKSPSVQRDLALAGGLGGRAKGTDTTYDF